MRLNGKEFTFINGFVGKDYMGYIRVVLADKSIWMSLPMVLDGEANDVAMIYFAETLKQVFPHDFPNDKFAYDFLLDLLTEANREVQREVQKVLELRKRIERMWLLYLNQN